MKKKLIVAVVTLCFAYMNAQTNSVEFGVKAGANLSKITDYTPESKYVPGFQAGGFAQYSITDKLRLQTELLFSLEGGRSSFNFEDEFQSFMIKSDITFGYVNLPVMLQYKLFKGLHLEAGPQLGYLVLAENAYETKFSIGDVGIDEKGTESIIDDMNRFSLGVNLGLQYDISNRFFVQARYNKGLTKLAKNPFTDEEGEGAEQDTDFDKVRNQSFSLGFGYRF